MRFSSIFHAPLPAPAAMEEPTALAVPPIAVLPAVADTDLPEALDERVRLIGEWQLGA